MFKASEFEKMKIVIDARGLLVLDENKKVLQKFSDGIDVQSFVGVVSTIMKTAEASQNILNMGTIKEVIYYTGKEFKLMIGSGIHDSQKIIVAIILSGSSNVIPLRGFLSSLLKKKGMTP